MKLLGIVTALAVVSNVALAQPNPCGGGAAGPRMPPRPQPPLRATPDPAKTYAIKIDTFDAVDGLADAKVTIVDTSDYACPYCEKVRETLAGLKTKYGKDLRIVYKQFVVHPAMATAFSLAACAATKQKKFAEVDAALWADYGTKQFDKDAMVDGKATQCWHTKEGCPLAIEAARGAKLDIGKFMADMVSCDSSVKASMAELTSFGVAAIPMFFINGRPLPGAQRADRFEAVIDEELAKATTRIKAGTKAGRYYQDWVVEKGEKKLASPQPSMDPCGGGM